MTPEPPEVREHQEARRLFHAAAQRFAELHQGSAQCRGQELSLELREAWDEMERAKARLKAAKAARDAVLGPPEPVPLTHAVSAKITQLFSPGEQAAAIALLETECARSLPFHEASGPQELEQVRLAALKVSGGDLSRLRAVVQDAKRDWRDVIVAAEYPAFKTVGFAGANRLTAGERDELRARDREQYLAWLRDAE